LGRFGPFRYGTKVDAKLAEQVQLAHKFAKQTPASIFRHERTRSTQMHPKLMFWGHLGPFRYGMKLDNKLAELAPSMHKFAKRSSVGTFRNERNRPLHWTQNSFFGGVSGHFITTRKSIQNWPNWLH
jgi:hypothetical protein